MSLNVEAFTGNLTEAGTVSLAAGPDRLALAAGDVWVGAHASLLDWRGLGRDAARRAPSQIFRVRMAGGVPQAADQVFGDDGTKIAGAAVGAAAGKRLLVGSPLDDKLLDCAMP